MLHVTCHSIKSQPVLFLVFGVDNYKQVALHDMCFGILKQTRTPILTTQARMAMWTTHETTSGIIKGGALLLV